VQIPVYAASFQLGSYLFADATLVKYDIEVLNQLYSFTRRFLIAHLIIVSGITLVTYFVTWTTLSLKQVKKTPKNTSSV